MYQGDFMKKCVVFFIVILSLCVCLTSCNTETYSVELGYTISCNASEYGQSYFSTVELTIKTQGNFIDVYWHTVDEFTGGEDFNHYYIIQEDGVVYVVQHRTYYIGGELYKTGYGVSAYYTLEELIETRWNAFWLENNNFGSVENMDKLLEFLFLATDVAIPESNEDFSFIVNGDFDRDYDDEKAWCCVFANMDLFFLEPAEYVIEVKDIGTTPTGVATMPSVLQNFKNMVGQTVEVEGPAYYKYN